MARTGGAGIVDKPSNHSVDETVQRLKDIIHSRGLTLFAMVDHSGEAEKVGVHMPPTKLVIFGSPKAAVAARAADAAGPELQLGAQPAPDRERSAGRPEDGPLSTASLQAWFGMIPGQRTLPLEVPKSS